MTLHDRRRRWFLAAGVAYVWHLASRLLFPRWWEPVTEPGVVGVAICVAYGAYYHGRIKQQEERR